MAVSDETLILYADGELDAPGRAVEAELASDPALVKRLEIYRALRRLVRDGFAEVADAPVPEHLIQALGVAPFADPVAPPATPERRRLPGWGVGVLVGAAMAACLAAGLVIGGRLSAAAAPLKSGEQRNVLPAKR